MQQIFKYPFYRKLLTFLGLLLTGGLLVYTLRMLDRSLWHVALALSVPLSGVLLYNLVQLLYLQSRYVLEGDRLVEKRFFQERETLFSNILGVSNIPSAGEFKVFSKGKTIRISRNLRDFNILADNLERVILEKEGWKHYKPPFVVNKERSSYYVYSFLILLSGWFAYQIFNYVRELGFLNWALGIQSAFILFIAYLVFRMVFLIPRQYVFLKQQVRVRFLLGEVVYRIADLQRIESALYYFRGARMYRFRFYFNSKPLDLDELGLNTSLQEVEEFVKINYRVPLVKVAVDG